MTPFILTPKHWWTYLNPFWWRRKRIVEAVLAHEFKRYEKAFYNATRDALLYGKGSVRFKP
jgi:hypothetical protein